MDKATQKGLWVLLQAVLTHAHALPEPLVKQVQEGVRRLTWPPRVIDVSCPECGAAPRQHCHPNPGSRRRAAHLARYGALGVARRGSGEGGEERLDG